MHGGDMLYTRHVMLDYTNHRGERSWRRVKLGNAFFGTTNFHREPQLLINAFDYDRNAERTFAVKDIHEVKPVNLNTVSGGGHAG